MYYNCSHFIVASSSHTRNRENIWQSFEGFQYCNVFVSLDLFFIFLLRGFNRIEHNSCVRLRCSCGTVCSMPFIENQYYNFNCHDTMIPMTRNYIVLVVQCALCTTLTSPQRYGSIWFIAHISTQNKNIAPIFYIYPTIFFMML